MINWLRQARREIGWPQGALAERIGTNVQAVKRLERGIGPVATLVAVMTARNFRLTGIGLGKNLLEQLRSRHKHRLSSNEVAAKTGMSRTTIASLERGGGSVASLLCLLAMLALRARRRERERSYWGEGDQADRDSRFTPFSCGKAASVF